MSGPEAKVNAHLAAKRESAGRTRRRCRTCRTIPRRWRRAAGPTRTGSAGE